MAPWLLLASLLARRELLLPRLLLRLPQCLPLRLLLRLPHCLFTEELPRGWNLRPYLAVGRTLRGAKLKPRGSLRSVRGWKRRGT